MSLRVKAKVNGSDTGRNLSLDSGAELLAFLTDIFSLFSTKAVMRDGQFFLITNM